MDNESTGKGKENRDPITGEPGSHPVGTGLGTTGGAAAGAAIGAAIGGPAGAVAGAAVGGVAGALGGRGVAEAVNPTIEEQYWRENHPSQPYATEEFGYEHYEPAYRLGYEAVGKFPGKKFEEIEDEIALEYAKSRPESALPWDQVRPATKAAWDKVSGVVSPRDPTRGIRSGF